MSYFENKIIVVFGATGVFGQHVARSLRERGADVRLIVRHADALPSDLRDLPLAELESSRCLQPS
jgi:nucleoside-diphosphate-sugar epimerase